MCVLLFAVDEAPFPEEHHAPPSCASIKGGHENETFAAFEAFFRLQQASARNRVHIQRRKVRGRRKVNGSNGKALVLGAKSMEQTEKSLVLDDKS